MKNAPLYEVRKIRDLRDMLDQSVKIFRDKTAFLIKKGRGEAYTSVSYKEFGDDVNAFGTSLTDLNGLGSRVAILAETRYEWNVTYLATTNGAGVIIPLDKELNKLEIANLMNRSHADILVYSGSKQPLIDEISAEIPSVKHFICMDRLPEKSSAIVFADLLDKGRKLLEDGTEPFLMRQLMLRRPIFYYLLVVQLLSQRRSCFLIAISV